MGVTNARPHSPYGCFGPGTLYVWPMSSNSVSNSAEDECSVRLLFINTNTVIFLLFKVIVLLRTPS